MKNGLRINENSGQATLELAVALVMVMLFIACSVKIFVWLNTDLVRRQRNYDNTRLTAGSSNSGVPVDESDFEPLNIFK